MRRDLLAASYLWADETPVPVQMHGQRGENHQAYLWQYGKPVVRRCSIFVWAGGVRARAVLGLVGRDLANRWLFGLRRYRRTQAGARGVLGTRAPQISRRSQRSMPTIPKQSK
jgi:hypothetical protein